METDSEHLGPRQSSRKESARGLVSRARDAERRGDTARSLGLYDDAIEALEREQDPALLADALRWKGTLHREQGETEAVRLLGMIEQNRGVLFNMRGNFVAAEARYANSLGAFERANDDEAVSWVLNNLGMLYTKLGHYQRAIETFVRGLTIAKLRGDSVVESVITLNLAEVWVATGKLDAAEKACISSLEGAQTRGDHLTIAEALKCRARIERERGAFHESIATLRIGIFEAEGLEDRLLQAEMLREFGQTSRALGNAADAQLAWREAAESFEDVGAQHEAAEINALLASLPS